ncbi:MAG: HIT domain-containing protein [Armatimonadota bacterium]|nr:MAG: HIT domain-containing protein [Armatimonadota bacterium]
MNHLWAPWRMGYVAAEQPEGCIFCTKPAADDDEANQILYRGDQVFIMLNAFPYNTGHLLVAPFRHLSDALDMSPQESGELLYGIRIAIEVLRAAFEPQGFNIGLNLGQVAGAGYADHVHVHVVPRWSGDTNFMAITTDTRVVPEALADTFRRLKDKLAEREAELETE